MRTGARLGHYEILEELGRGGMGQVFLATDTKLGRRVALKILPSEFAESEERFERFQREARVIASLNHPNIVTIFSVEEREGVHFLTMELVEGETLDRSIPEEGLQLDQFFELAIPLADALSAAEEKGIAHRDIKPTNIMVSDRNTVKMLDFGLAKLLEPPASEEFSDLATEYQTGGNAVLGTLPYMSPEHVQAGNIDHRSDIFSLGIVLYQMATGRRPFDGETSADLISSILRDQASAISETKEEWPNHLSRIVRRCLEKDPERRYQTAKDLRNDLVELRREVEAGEHVISQTAVRESSRRSRAGAGRVGSAARRWIGIILVAALVGSGLWLWDLAGSQPTGQTSIDLAVMPFLNDLPDARDDYLAEGLSAGLLTRLDELGNVRVAGRDATWALAERNLGAQDVAKRLGVSHVLEGEIGERGDLLEVVPRLVDGGTGIVLWSSPILGRREDPLALQRELVTRLTDVLEIPVSRRERRRLARDPTGSMKAYEYYLKGQQRLRDRGASPEFAVASFREALRLDDGFVLAHAGLSEALRYVYARERNPAVLAEAEVEAERAVELDPASPAAHMARARLYRSTGRLDASISELKELLADHPKPGEAYRQLAFAFREAGDSEQALACLQAAVSQDPDEWSAWNSLGNLLLRLGRYDQAREAFVRAMSVAPEGINWPQQNLATVALYEGDFEKAAAAYEQVGGESHDVGLVSNIATANFFLGNLDRAEELYRLAVELNPQNEVSHRNLGDLYTRQGRRELARQEYREALQLVEAQLEDAPGNTRLHLQQALLAAKAEECEPALRQADQLIRDQELDVEATHQLAQTWALCGERDLALDALHRAVALGLSPQLVVEEDEFRTLRDDPEFQTLGVVEHD